MYVSLLGQRPVCYGWSSFQCACRVTKQAVAMPSGHCRVVSAEWWVASAEACPTGVGWWMSMAVGGCFPLSHNCCSQCICLWPTPLFSSSLSPLPTCFSHFFFIKHFIIIIIHLLGNVLHPCNWHYRSLYLYPYTTRFILLFAKK